MEKEKAQAVEQQAKVSEQKKAEEFKAQLEAQLKHQRLAAQQVGELLVGPPVSNMTKMWGTVYPYFTPFFKQFALPVRTKPLNHAASTVYISYFEMGLKQRFGLDSFFCFSNL